MLKTIIATNFQRHEYIEIVMDPRVTVLVGDNGTGKSAIVRALLWAALGKWGGDANGFIRWGADNARVELVFEDGIVARQKGKAGNLHFINGAQFEGDMSRSIPEAYRKLVNLTEDNFHQQLDPAFWFSLTAGQVAKSLNKIVNLSSIDDTLADIASRLRAAKQEQTFAQGRFEVAQNLKISLDWTKTADEDLARLEELQRTKEEKVEFHSALARKCQELAVTTRIRDDARVVVLCGKSIIEKVDKVDKLRKQVATISKHMSRIELTTASLARTKAVLAKKRPRLQEARAGQCPLCLK